MGGPRHGPDFQNLHRNKRSITLNLKEPEGKAVFMKLVEKADVVVENYRADVKFRLGIDYESLKKVNPRIILGSISGFGQDGPYAERAGFDQIAQGMGGLMWVTGTAGRRPGARRHRRRRRGRGPALRHRHPDRAAGARGFGAGPVGVELAAAGDDLDVRLPGRALDAGQGRAGPGRQQPSDLDPDRRLQDQRRLHQHRGLGRPHLQALLREHQGAGAADRRALLVRQGPRQEPRRAERRRSTSGSPPSPAPSGREAEQGRRAGRADLQDGRDVRRPAGQAPEDGASRALIPSSATSS